MLFCTNKTIPDRKTTKVIQSLPYLPMIKLARNDVMRFVAAAQKGFEET